MLPHRLAFIVGPHENPRVSMNARLSKPQDEGEALVRSGLLALLIVVAGCSSDTPVPHSDPQASAALLKKDCEDPKWKEENLGLWYSVCRQPLRW
jgi:hypothetical protein